MVLENSLRLSAVSVSIDKAGSKTSNEALPHEVFHNLQYQHNWTDLRIHAIIPHANPPIMDITTSSSNILPMKIDRTYLMSGVPPRHSYIHPDFLAHLVQHNLEETDIEIQREWVLPMSTGERWTLERFCHVFDHLPTRIPREGTPGFKHQDAKRVLCGMKSNDGSGGDGTIVYYIMQEGEVKPRQN